MSVDAMSRTTTSSLAPQNVVERKIGFRIINFSLNRIFLFASTVLLLV